MATVSANIGGTNFTSTNSKTPYQDMYNQYAKQQQGIRDAFKAQLQSDQQNDINKANAQYDNAARQNYINYMTQRKNLPDELSANNINGGASESALIRLGTNYGSNIASNEAARGSALNDLNQTYADRLAQYEEEYGNKLQSAYLTMLENQQKWEQEQREKDLQYFANSITGRFSSVSQYKDLINQLRASSDPNKEYKIALAQQAMNALAQSSSSGGGGSSRSYGGGYSYSGGGGSGTTASSIDASALANAMSGAAGNTISTVRSNAPKDYIKRGKYVTNKLGLHAYTG